ncbi:ABC transporter ATP-binding protein [Verminephrobacter eiseniae]|uniref:ABC transporter ATP-binding protein n=1 Tax=Verminephrobacter eiseniae TaxID=364317 RepID=UPI002238F361|nr:ABC transporter ATP-binding protein [Verminephrobacter eiseniae]MCW5235179.1 ABC transporter ATP-binding protein [Verminephrobacter eiseniae]
MISVDNVVAGYRTPGGLLRAVDGVSLQVRDGEILGIAGESGCGKSTLLKLLYGSFSDGLEIFSGSVTWRDREGARTLDVKDFHRHWWSLFSYVPQGSMSAMNMLMKIGAQMIDAGSAHGVIDRTARAARIRSTLAELDLPEEVLGLYPHQLSGGMRQRVLIGLATYVDPEVILADEPTTALDVVVQRQILENLVRLQRARQNSIVIVSHDLGLHYQVADQVAILYAGRLVELGSAQSVLRNPQHPYTRGLVGALPRLGDKLPRQGIDGRPPSLLDLPGGCRFLPRCAMALPSCAQAQPALRPVGPGWSAACHRLEECR